PLVHLTPVNTQQLCYDTNNDKAIMKIPQNGRTIEKGYVQNNIQTLGVAPKVSVPRPNWEEPKHIPRIYDLAARVDPKLLLDQILNSLIQLTAREILAVSKDSSGSLMDLIK
ncbi:uncharacterized protein F5147DRAFT_558428, partial [Suillus discolor]